MDVGGGPDSQSPKATRERQTSLGAPYLIHREDDCSLERTAACSFKDPSFARAPLALALLLSILLLRLPRPHLAILQPSCLLSGLCKVFRQVTPHGLSLPPLRYYKEKS